ncbi:hypothetical protein SAMN06264348_11024 [Oceanospirillum linum]|nr:hypothetical protein SAMN04489856_110108 [Oleiphilus messinensis]SMP33100.1 hypothetical protein SAMN06264348_11024 [Oceanospirillum linum]
MFWDTLKRIELFLNYNGISHNEKRHPCEVPFFCAGTNVDRTFSSLKAPEYQVLYFISCLTEGSALGKAGVQHRSQQLL